MDQVSQASDRLALYGGSPVYNGPWPTWPSATGNTLAHLADVAQSGRWAISGSYTGIESYERRFSQAFAELIGIPHAVPTANGTSALTIALEALRIGHGHEVLVPGLTWVACASAAAALGATPVLVDVDPGTLGMSLAGAEAAINERTTAIMLVHPYCQVVDPEAFRALADRHGLHLIEDGSQAHGAEWRGRKVGTFGSTAAFSLQQVKLLTCGEGGVAVTADRAVYDLMQELRADGRRYSMNKIVGRLDLEEIGSIQGRNFCLSEFQSAVALAQIEGFEARQALRQRNAAAIAQMMAEVPGCTVPAAHPAITKRSFYQFLVRLDTEVLGTFDPAKVVAAIGAETGVFCEFIDAPLNGNILYDPLKSPRTPASPEVRAALDPKRFPLPVAWAAHRSHVAFGHWALLGTQTHCEVLVDALRKVVRHIDQLRPG